MTDQGALLSPWLMVCKKQLYRYIYVMMSGPGMSAARVDSGQQCYIPTRSGRKLAGQRSQLTLCNGISSKKSSISCVIVHSRASLIFDYVYFSSSNGGGASPHPQRGIGASSVGSVTPG